MSFTPAASQDKKPVMTGQSYFSAAIRAAIAQDDLGAFMQIDPVLALGDDDKGLHGWVSEHVKAYRALPSPRAYKEAFGSELSRPPEGSEVLLAKAASSHIINQQTALILRMKEMFSKSLPSSELLREMSKAYAEAARAAPAADIMSLQEAFYAVGEQYLAERRGSEKPRIRFGWPAFDELTGGGEPGDLITGVARPNVGKTFSLLHNANTAHDDGESILFLSNEMEIVRVARRLLGVKTGFNPDLIRRAQLSSHAYDEFLDALRLPDSCADWNFLSGGFGVRVSSLRQAIEKCRPSAVYIDASYLMKADSSRDASRDHENAARLEGELKNIALDYELPIFKTVQFNREMAKETKTPRGKDSGETKRKDPTLETIGGTDSIGKDGTIIYAIEAGDEGHVNTARRMTCLKARDSEKMLQWHINYLFNPVDFSEKSVRNDDEDMLLLEEMSVDEAWGGEECF